jgi:hypothetical protein
MDAPDPGGQDVIAFAAKGLPPGSGTDANAEQWTAPGPRGGHESLEGAWSSRWNGAADPTIEGDSKNAWKVGRGEARVVGDRVYLLFDWNHGARRALLEARREGSQGLVGRYVNLSDPTIVVPWVGRIVSNERVDGRFPRGRLDFRR